MTRLLSHRPFRAQDINATVLGVVSSTHDVEGGGTTYDNLQPVRANR
ncbi:MAG: hypothetical protein KGO02_18160 [Alphaproteobacteria bacterium]|nr:hypothetical protein [Alphaproteobacteria bacterium]